jgi:hypothetical protein
MQSTGAPSAPQLAPCQANGPVAKVVELGDEHRALGDFENAWTSYTLALRYWLRLQYMAVYDRTECPFDDMHLLANKLRARLAIDAWTHAAIGSILRRPAPVGWLQVDIAAGIVKALFGLQGGVGC